MTACSLKVNNIMKKGLEMHSCSCQILQKKIWADPLSRKNHSFLETKVISKYLLEKILIIAKLWLFRQKALKFDTKDKNKRAQSIFSKNWILYLRIFYERECLINDKHFLTAEILISELSWDFCLILDKWFTFDRIL